LPSPNQLKRRRRKLSPILLQSNNRPPPLSPVNLPPLAIRFQLSLLPLIHQQQPLRVVREQAPLVNSFLLK